MENTQILQRLDSLIKVGEDLLNTKYYEYIKGDKVYLVDKGLFIQWWTSCTTLLNLLPAHYIYASEYEHHCHDYRYECAEMGLGILRAVKEDIENGLLQKVEDRVYADIFSDFLEMAEHLLDNECKDPAAFLIGAVLEDKLRRMCQDNDIAIKSDENISTLNQKLFQKNIYTKPQMKQIEHWKSIRDSADHGKFEEYDAESVKHMLEGVRNFLTSQLS